MRIAAALGWWCNQGNIRAFNMQEQLKKFNRSISLKCPPLLSVDSPDVWTTPNPTTTTNISSPSNSSAAQFSSTFTANEHTTVMLVGKIIANDIKSEIASEICEMKKSIGKTPGLGIVIVGQRRDSRVFVHTKLKACNKVGIVSVVTELPEDCKEVEVCNAVSRFNEKPLIHGVIVQLPLSKHLDEEKIMNVVSVEKDVDGFHPLNVGNLAIKGREPLFIPCAPKGCLELLPRYGVELKGKKVAVIGRSKIVGLPTSLLLQRHHATVSVVHAFTINPEQITCVADILVSDVGVPNIVRGHWLRPGAIVVDMGTNSMEDARSSDGYRLVGDVCYEEAIGKALAITPVPGGIGPITISMLLSNTLDSAKRFYNFF